MSVKLLTEHHLEFPSLKGGCIDSSESTLVKMPHCWKSHVAAQLCAFQQCGILTSVDSGEPVQPPAKLRSSKCCSASSLTVIQCNIFKRLAKALIRLRVCAD